MNFDTTYLGLNISSPVVPCCSAFAPLSDFCALEKAGAGAICLAPLFEEQLACHIKNNTCLCVNDNDYGDTIGFIANHQPHSHIDDFFNAIYHVTNRISIPLIGSINCFSHGNWIDYVNEFKRVGCKALDVNIALYPSSVSLGSDDVERTFGDILRALYMITDLPVSLRISPHFTDMAKTVQQLSWMHLAGLSLFNWSPSIDVDIETQSLHVTNAHKSDYGMLPFFDFELKWVAFLRRSISSSLSVSSGHPSYDSLAKAILVGCDAVHFPRALNAATLSSLLSDFGLWMSRHNYSKIDDFKGSLALSSTQCAQNALRLNLINDVLCNINS